jgi:hypothetical protein
MGIKHMRTHCCHIFQIFIVLTTPLLLLNCVNAMEPKSVKFQGRISEHKWSLQELNRDLATDWSAYEYLVLEMRTSTPQRFGLWL